MNRPDIAAEPREADVALMLEGTYPYVPGGVSAWVDQIVRGLPEVTFALVYLGSQRVENPTRHFKIPANVVSLTEIYLHDRLPNSELTPGRLPEAARARIYGCLEAFYNGSDAAARRRQLWEVIDALAAAGSRFTFGNLCHDRQAWDILERAYDASAPSESFIDFFWTTRFLHLPLWALWRARDRLPAARVYHSISAGYAGLLGALAGRTHGRPFFVTEHGIYTKERIAEISQADWIHESEADRIDLAEGLGALKRLWIELFMLLGHAAYDAADPIVTLFDGNAVTQVEFGADARKIRVVPNGIEPEQFDAVRAVVQQRWATAPARKVVGFIGRVVPIKDVKTLLRAARLVCEREPETTFLIAGPYAEDPNYFDECQKIVKLLQIDRQVQFLGMQKVMEILPRMDVLVLTSISEGLPLVILEAFAAGIPVVATDVGACRELIFGRTPEDKALGRAGRLTKILSPQETAQALLGLLRDAATWLRASEAGRLRAERFYSMRQLLQTYRELYAELAAQASTDCRTHP